MALQIAGLLIFVICAGMLASSSSSSPAISESSLFNYVVVIMMENHGINDTYGSHCLGNCTFITDLANQNGVALRYSGIAHTSLPNYLVLTSGGNYDTAPFNRDCYPENLTTGCFISGPNLVDSISNSGRTWKAYMEDHTSGGCLRSNNPPTYENSHNPFLYYTDIYNNSTRCANIVNANPGAAGFLALPEKLLTDLNSTTTAPNFMWLTPNLCDDGHNLCKPLNNTVSQSNMYLSLLVPAILNSTIFRTQNAALFITWDEASSLTNNIVTAIWAGPAAKKGFNSSNVYDDYSATKTIEVAWGLPTLYTNDTNANSMIEFFAASTSTGVGAGGRRPLAL